MSETGAPKESVTFSILKQMVWAGGLLLGLGAAWQANHSSVERLAADLKREEQARITALAEVKAVAAANHSEVSNRIESVRRDLRQDVTNLVVNLNAIQEAVRSAERELALAEPVTRAAAITLAEVRTELTSLRDRLGAAQEVLAVMAVRLATVERNQGLTLPSIPSVPFRKHFDIRAN